MPGRSILGSSCGKLIGVGTPRGLQGRLGVLMAIVLAIRRVVRCRWAADGATDAFVAAMRARLTRSMALAPTVLHHGLLESGVWFMGQN